MPRFLIGSQVKIVGAVAENYKCLIGVMIQVLPDPRGLSHLNKYEIQISECEQEKFYEFQLRGVDDLRRSGQKALVD